MTESAKTIGFVVAAAATMALSGITYFVNQPKTGKEFELVGEDFYPAFESSAKAQSLEVAAIDSEGLQLQRFSVQNENGTWRIPSHHNYPAEAADRLARTATSVMGVTRDALAGRLASEHERLGVVDPLGDELDDPEAAGKRITLKDADGEVLVDYIIGKEAEAVAGSDVEQAFEGSSAQQKYYYVRRPDEQQTYKVAIDVDLTTKFSDWIDTDLLRLNRTDLVNISVDNYELAPDPSNPAQLMMAKGDELELRRSTSTDPWTLEGLNDQKEELETQRINDIIDILGDMKITGVRPKTKFKGHVLLTPELKLNRQKEFEEDVRGFQVAISRLQQELEERGFNLAGSQDGMQLVSNNGELSIGTNEGVRYTLQVGNVVEGEEQEIEIGGGSSAKTDKPEGDESAEDSTDSNPEDGAGDADPAESTEGDADNTEEAEEEGKNRFLMIRVTFDEGLLGEKPAMPVEPSEPTKPEGYEPAPKEDPAEQQEDSNATGDVPEAPPGENSDGEANSEQKSEEPEKPARNPEFVAYDAAVAQYEQAKVDFELAKTKFEDDTKAYEKKVEDGKKKIDELNERFGDWYYVISADNLKTLQTTRDDLVKEKEIPEDERIPERPDISFPNLEGESDVPQSSPESKSDGEADDQNSAATETESGGDGETEANSNAGDSSEGNG